jgi:alpha-tubulin suppressor-like RCC1 family protein
MFVSPSRWLGLAALAFFSLPALGIAQVATPTFSPNGGWFVIERPVTVSDSTAGATINYTTNGATPTSTDRTVASGATVLVDRPLTLKANATKTGMTPSGTASASFTISGRIIGGQNHTVSLKTDGTVWTWGSNSVGQLAIGSADSSAHSSPSQAKLNSSTMLSGVSGVGAGASHSLAIKSSDGSVYGWGNDAAGQLGDNSTATQQVYPVQVKTTASGNPLLTGVIEVAGGLSHSIALKSDGTVWTWGNNATNQLGDGGTTSRKLAGQVKTANNSFLTGIVAIAAGDNFCVALKSDGTVWAWGSNASGQIGIGSTTNQKFAVQVKLSGGAALSGITEITCGSAHVATLKSDGTVWAWGSNANGQLGNGGTAQATNPVQARLNSTTFIGGGYALAAGASHTLVLKTDGSVWASGLNSSGQLSINSTVQQLFFVQGSAGSGVILSGVVDIGAGGSHSVVTQSDGTVLGCGLNSSGQAGYPITTINPTRATPVANFVIISAFADPDNDGLLTWRERELGTNPAIADTDGDGIPDGWEVNHNLNPIVNDGAADPDGDGYTNLQEYQNNTDPYDYFNAAAFTLTITSGNNQASPAGLWLGQPLVVRTANGSGASLNNAPVTFSLAQAGGGLSLTDHGSTASTLSLRTDTSGQATVYYQQPNSGPSAVNVQAGTGNVQQVTFTASFLNLPITGLKLWLRSDAGITKNANNLVSLWRDQSPAGNNAAQAVTGNSPLFVANGWSGKPVIRFNGSTSSMNGALSVSSQMSVFAVAAEGNLSGFKRIINNEGHFFLGAAPDGNFASFYGNGSWGTTQSHPFALSPGQFAILESVNNGSDSSYVNGQLIETRVNPMTAFTSGFELGRHVAGIQYWDGDIVELLVYDGALSTSDRQAIETYLNQKYNLIVPPATPTGLTATAMSFARIDVVWTASTGASSYSIERKSGASGTYAPIGTAASRSFSDTAVTAGVEYYYRVIATNVAGSSGYSAEASAGVDSLPAIPTSSVAFWLRAECGVTKDDSNRVASWVDQSGLNGAGTQSNAVVQPVFVGSALGGKPAVRFDGADDLLNLPNFGGGLTEGEVFVVAKATATQVDVATLWMIGDDYIWGPNTYPGGDGTVWETFGTRNQKNTGVPTQPLTRAHVYNVSSKAGEFVTRFNGTEHFRTTSNTVFFPSSPRLGGGIYDRHRFGGDIAELIVFNHVLTATERSAVQGYLGSKYQTVLVPAAPTNLIASAFTASQATLNWTGSTGVIAIERKTGANGTYTQIGTASGSVFNDNGLLPAAQYFYRIRTSNFAGYSDYSNEASVTTTASGATLPMSGIKLWLRGDFGVVSNVNNLVTTWTDESGNGNSATAGSSTAPLAVGNAIGNKPALRFNGQNTSLSLPNLLQGATAAEAFVILRAASSSPSGNRGLWSFGSNYRNAYPQSNGQIVDDFGSGDRYTFSPNAPITEQHLYNVVSSSTEWTSRMNGAVQFTYGNNGVGFWSWPVLGSGGAVSGYGSTNFDGDIAEVLIYDHALTQSERDAVTAYCMRKYGLLDSDADGIVDWKEAQLGTNPSNPDTDGDGMPDGWEINHSLNPLANDAGIDSDGDTYTNLQEYQNGTDPFDYYNGAAFNMVAASGSGQFSPAGTWAPQPLVAHVSNGSGASLVNAPVTFTVQSGGGLLSNISGGATSGSVTVLTDSFGDARAYYQEGNTPDIAGAIRAQAGIMAVSKVTFITSTADIPLDSIKLWLNAEAGVVASGGNVTAWADQSGSDNNALCNSGHNPIYISNAIAGRPAIAFYWNPTNWYATSMAGPLSLGPETSVFAAGSVYGYSTGSVITNDKHIYFGNDGSGYFATYYGNGTSWNNMQSHSLQLPANTYNILESVNGPVESAYVNGILLQSRPNPMTAFSNGYSLGRDLNGYIAEVLVYDRSLTDAERIRVESYFNRRYNIVAAPPAAPANLTGVVTSSSEATLSWNAQPGVLFKIERKTGSNGTYSQIGATTQSGITSFVDTAFTAGPQYFYRIRATNMVGDSNYSNWVLVSTAPDADENGLLDQWEIQYFGQIGVNPAGDADNDGFTNLQEFQLGTDPTNSTSGPVLTSGAHAQFISQTVPGTMVAGRSYSVSVTMRNSGTTEWTLPAGANPCVLGIPGLSSEDTSSWGRVTVALPNAVPSGQLVTFNFTVTTPLEAGSYHFQWAMLQPGAQWFDEFTPDTVLAIIDPSLAVGAVAVTDLFNDWSVVSARTAGWAIVHDGTAGFEGDDSRLVRLGSSLESVTYAFPGIVGTSATIYYRNGLDLSQLHFLTSTDGTIWSPLAVEVSTAIPQADGWLAVTVSQDQSVPAGTNYLKVEVTGAAFADLQIGEIRIIHADQNAPTLEAATISLAPDADNTITLDASDADGDPLTFTIVTLPAHGSITGSGPAFIYAPDAGYQGLDTFSVSASDGFLTSGPVVVNLVVQPPSVIPPSAVTVVDELANFDLIAAHSEYWQFDTNNPANFGGDLSRAVRTASSAESLTYTYSGIAAFSAVLYSTSETTSDALRLYASVDGTTWTRVAFAQPMPTALVGGWSVGSIDATAALPAGTNYVRIELRGANAITPELGRVILSYTGADTDANGLADQWEIAHFGAIGADPNADADGDGLTNIQEYRLGTDPLAHNDSDGDGMSDAWEVQFGLNPTVNDAAADLDGDGVDNLTEFLQGRDPTKGTIDGASVINLQVFTPLQ